MRPRHCDKCHKILPIKTLLAIEDMFMLRGIVVFVTNGIVQRIGHLIVDRSDIFN